MLPRSFAASLLAAAALAVTASSALAADTYVDGDTGDDTLNTCLTPASPCKTIGQGLIKAGTGNTVHVDDASPNYPESLEIEDGKSLLAEDFDSSHTGSFTIFGTSGPTIKVPAGNTAGTVSGFTIAPAAGQETIFLEGPATFRDNQINNPNPGATALDLSTPAGGTGSVIDHNTFNGDGSTANTAIGVFEGTPEIINNNISTPSNGFNTGIRVANGSNPTITGNHFQAIFDSGTPGAAILVFDSHATIIGNRVDQAIATGDVNGIIVQENSTATGATIRRNQLFGVSSGTGVNAFQTSDSVTLDSNLVAGYNVGIRAEGTSNPVGSDGDVSVSNGTFAANGQDIEVADAHITLDSSIVEDSISVSGGGNPGCTITFSRGPSTLPGTCTQFQTTAAPGFVSTGGPNAESNDYHLMPLSAMVDAGDPASPPAGAADFEGGPRACDGDGDGALRRDIGADELRTPSTDDCTAPNTGAGKVKVKRAKRKAKRQARVTFTSTDPGSTFQCKLDSRPMKSCARTTVFRKLKLGRHTFTVRATDAFGNVDQTPATGKFRVRRVRTHH